MTKLGILTQSDFNKLMVNFLLTEPFFASIMRLIRKKRVETKAIPTAGVCVEGGGFTMYWNPNFVAKLTKIEFFGLLKHECYHLIFKHVTTRKQDPFLLWNIATDLAINSIIRKDELPSGGLRPGQPFKDLDSIPDKKAAERAKKISDLIESLPLGKASEWYMEKLLSDPDMQEEIEKHFDKGDCGFDVHLDGDDLSDSEREFIEGKLKQSIKEAADRAQKTNGWGTVSADVKQQIFASLDDSVNWKKALHYFCGTKQKANKSRTFRRINRKYPYIHPGRKVSRTSNLAIYIDQSGSVSDSGISAFFDALNMLARDVGFTVYHFDTRVDEDNKYDWRKNKKYRLPMRTLTGGTCFQAVETHFRKRAGKYDGYIVMSDGCAAKPDSTISKRCWVLLPGCELAFSPDSRDALIKMKD
jgi:predicted metal-dependent peptidase|tara:strand:- start:4277 stop:5521 length:1245 start_codon:yes stop_codon:yes gene_type:complete